MREFLRRLSEQVVNRLARFNRAQWVALIAALAGIWLLLLVAVVLLARPQRPPISRAPSQTPPPFSRTFTPSPSPSSTATPTPTPSTSPSPEDTATPSQVPSPTPRGPQSFYTAPNGSPGGDGSQASPWDLFTALQDRDAVLPGDTLWLMGGTYGSGAGTLFESQLHGEADKPVTIRVMPGQRATLDGGLVITGDYSVLWGLEVMNSETRRQTLLKGSNPNDIERKGGITVLGSGTALINNIVHDTKNGIEMWSEAVDTLAYGNIVYNNGFRGPDRTHGHGIYAQNQEGVKQFDNNIVFNNFSTYNVHVYTEEGFIQGFEFDGNIVFNGQFLVGGLQPAARISVVNNHLYHSQVRFGYKNEENGDLTLKNNYFGGNGDSTLEVKWWQKLDVSGNTIWNEGNNNVELLLPVDPGDYHWNNNVYYASARNAFMYLDRRTGWEQWKESSHFDDQSALIEGEPKGEAVFFMPDRYEPGRANLIIYNWDALDEVKVDLSQAGIATGDRYRIHNAQNYFDEVIEGEYTGGEVAIPMRGWTAAAPLGMEKPLEQVTFPLFGVFVVEKI